jgi:hypothetical protein
LRSVGERLYGTGRCPCRTLADGVALSRRARDVITGVGRETPPPGEEPPPSPT